MKIVSIHIPKTAGTTFYDWLCFHFNDVSINLKRDLVRLDAFSGILHHEVVHGHIRFSEIAPYLKGHEKLITWVRNPIDRVISNYRFFIKTITEPIHQNTKVYQANAHRKNETLLEYAQRAETQNQMSKYLEGSDLNQFFFIGLFEEFQTELNHLSLLLKVSPSELYSVPTANKNRSEHMQVSDYERAEIARYNEKDVKLYAQIKAQKANV